jgi:diaminohydroxyphosphoribosylaminopyrimidine deaminase/5-amino-6-(5-phosphoribosylamino)uracil reductase
MRMAIAEGEKGAGFVSPNPLVGCVILNRDGELIAKGYHARVGDLHAETAALRQVKDPAQLEGAQFFVTLEPCAHEGRQPSCAKTLAALPIASVTYGLRDPNPLVAGRGAEILKAAGKTVIEFSGLKAELEQLAEIFLLNMRSGRPFVAVKVASSLDGQIALASGESQWITGEGARGAVHSLRGKYDAVLTGVGTVLKDNPKLNSRDKAFAGKRAKLVILDPDGELVLRWESLELTKVRAKEDILLCTRAHVSGLPEGIEHVTIPGHGRTGGLGAPGGGEFEIGELLGELAKRGIHSIFVEAGSGTVGSFLKAKLVDRLYLFLAPMLLGRGLSWTSGLSLASLDQAVRLSDVRIEAVDPDYLLSARPRFP